MPHDDIEHQRRLPFLLSSMNSHWQASFAQRLTFASRAPPSRSIADHNTASSPASVARPSPIRHA